MERPQARSAPAAGSGTYRGVRSRGERLIAHRTWFLYSPIVAQRRHRYDFSSFSGTLFKYIASENGSTYMYFLKLGSGIAASTNLGDCTTDGNTHGVVRSVHRPLRRLFRVAPGTQLCTWRCR